MFGTKFFLGDFGGWGLNCLDKLTEILKLISDGKKELQIDPFWSFGKNIMPSIFLRLMGVSRFISSHKAQRKNCFMIDHNSSQCIWNPGFHSTEFYSNTCRKSFSNIQIFKIFRLPFNKTKSTFRFQNQLY